MPRTLKVWTKGDKSTLLKEVNNAENKKQGFQNAAKTLGRTASACSARYYEMKAKPKQQVKIPKVSKQIGEVYHINGTLKNNEIEITGEFQLKFN